MRRSVTPLFPVAATCLAVVAGCGSGKGVKEKTGSNGITITEEGVLNGLAAAFPSSLVLSSPTTGGSVAPNLLESDGEPRAYALADGEIAREELADKPPLAKREENIKVLNAGDASACRPRLKFKKLPEPNCYGQTAFAEDNAVTSTAAPLLKFPLNLDPIPFPGVSGTKRAIRYGDSGIVREREGNNACLAAASSYQVGLAADTVDRATGLVASMLCAAKVEGTDSLPTVGERLDLREEVLKVWNAPAGTEVIEASIERLPGDGAIYHSALKMKYKDHKNEMRTIVVDLVNTPRSEDPSDYQGRLLVYETGADRIFGRGTNAVSIAYDKAGDGVNYKFQKVMFLNGAQPNDYLDEKGFFKFDLLKNSPPPGGHVPPAHLVDGFSLAGPGANDGRKAGNIVQGLFALNAKDGTGDFSYAWSASLNDPATRLMVVNVKKEDDGSLSGCGLAGYSDPFGTAGGAVGQVKGFFCGWGQSKNSGADHLGHRFERSAQKQCFKKNSGSENWDITSQKIKYVVDGDCGKDATGDLASWYDLEPLNGEGLLSGIRMPGAVNPIAVELKKDKLNTN